MPTGMSPCWNFYIERIEIECKISIPMEKNGRGKWNKTEEEFLNNPYHKEARKREKSKKKKEE